MSKKNRREFIQKVGAIIVLVLVGVGLSRDGRVISFLRNLKHRIASSSNNWRGITRSSYQGPDYQRSGEELPAIKEYRAFLDGLNLRYFSSAEIVHPHRNFRNGVQNNIPPKRMWPEIVQTLRVADEIRERLGVRVRLLSGYRSPDYNRAINGASRSQHMRNRALDLKFDCSADESFAMAEKLRKEGVFLGGIGWYPNFIHIDTRGYEATWGKES